MRPVRALLCLALPLLFACGAASAQILIGQTAGFSGPVAAGVKEVTDGAKLYFDAVNAKGGVHGQTIELLSMDDKFDPKLAAENARELVTKKNVLALFLTRGTPHTQAVMPLLGEYKVPLVAPSTGAMVLHKPVNPWLFNVRATYQREADRAVRHLSLVGVSRIAVVQVDDTFGADAIQGAMNAFAAVDKKPLFVEKYDRTKPDFSKIAPRIAGSDAQAVLFIGSGAA
ncbi:MAG TPA: ABC transporter substrate-binding protein, partial [Burkholderiaceae bacterium]